MKKNKIIYIKSNDYYYYFATVIITKTTAGWLMTSIYPNIIHSYQFSGLHFQFKKHLKNQATVEYLEHIREIKKEMVL